MRACRISLISAILFLICLSVACNQNQLNRAQQYELEGKNATALQLYQEALAQTSLPARRADILNRIGECLYRMDRMQEAFTTFQKAAEVDSDNISVRLRMGQMLLEAGAPERAREQAFVILKRSPANTEAQALLGAAWTASGNFDLAKQAYLRVLQNDPSRVKVAVALADIYNREDSEGKAKDVLKRAATADPHSSLPWLALARLDEQEGDSHGAEDAYRRAIAVEDTPETNLRLAQFLQRSARIAEAEQTLRRVDAQDPRYPVALADFQLLSGRPDDALDQYQKALSAAVPQVVSKPRWTFSFRENSAAQADSNDLNIVARMVEAETVAASKLQGDQRKQALAIIRSRLQENRARFDKATVAILEAEVAMADENLALAKLYANSAIDLAPTSAPAHYVAGLVAASSGDTDTAQTEWQNALDQDGHFGPARLALAEDALARGDGDEADDQARQVVRDTPGDLQAILVFARALLLEGKAIPAAIMAQRASALDPVSPEPALILGEVALKANSAPQALLQFERALALHPDSEEAMSGLLRVYQAGRLSYAAIQKMEKVAQQEPVSSTLLEVVGRLYADHGWYTDAIRALRRTVEIDPKRLTAARALARLQATTGDFAGATDSAMKAGVDAQTLLSAYHAQSSGDWHNAVAAYERALREGDQTGVAANNVAWLYAEHGSQLDRALSLAEIAAHASPNNPAVLDTLGFVHLQRREYSDAVKLLETAARLAAVMEAAPDNLETTDQIRRHLSEAYLKTGQTKAALKLAQNRQPFSTR